MAHRTIMFGDLLVEREAREVMAVEQSGRSVVVITMFNGLNMFNMAWQ